MVFTNPIKKIIDKQVDFKVHRAFSRYSIGEFEKEPIQVKKSKQITIQMGFEYLNFIQDFLANNLKEEAEIQGVIESVQDLKPFLTKLGLKFEEKKRFGKPGAKFELAIQKIKPDTYRQLVDNCFNDYLLFNINSSFGSLKVKNQTTPKIGSKTDGFVNLKLNNDLYSSFQKDYLFDIDQDFSLALINQTYFIDSIDINEKLLATDAEKARKEAKRIGKIKRVITLDDKRFKETEIKINV